MTVTRKGFLIAFVLSFAFFYVMMALAGASPSRAPRNQYVFYGWQSQIEYRHARVRHHHYRVSRVEKGKRGHTAHDRRRLGGATALVRHPHSVDANGNRAGFAKVHIANGGSATVAAKFQEQFQAFIDEVESPPDLGVGMFVDAQQGNRIGEIGCLSRGHMRHSKHHWGGACDFSQLRRSVTTDKFMYHVANIAHRHGLTDGCEWSNKDCGHIEVPTGNYSGRHYASRHHHRHYRTRYARAS